jgi:formylglycine-generating enzyme required for sulfatase activity
MRRFAMAALALPLLFSKAARAEDCAPSPTLQVALGSTQLVMILVPAGSFEQGSLPNEAGRGADETRRRVTISKPFYLGRSAITVGQFKRFVEATGYRTEAEKGTSGGFGWDGSKLKQDKQYTWKSPGFQQEDDEPVTIVTYDDALAFTAWVTSLTHRTVTLPTEAQREYAARRGAEGAYPGKSDRPLELGWFKDNSESRAHRIGQKQASAGGFYDLAGNVNEWCLDWYAPIPAGDATDPIGLSPDTSDGKSRRVQRGGAWDREVTSGRIAARSRSAPGSRVANNGFRVEADACPSASASPAQSPTTSSPQTPTPATPTPGGASSSNDSSNPFPLFALGGVGLGLYFVVRAVRRKRGGESPSFRLGPDGFWIDAAPSWRGRPVTLRVRIGRGSREQTVTIEPSVSGQFVYTGDRPLGVELLVAGAVARAASRPFAHDHRPYEPPPEPPRTYGGGYPPAY